MNTLKTTVLLAALTALILVAGQALGGTQGMQIALLMAAGMNFFAYWFSDKIVLAMHHARPADPREEPELHAITQQLCARSGLPMPRLYVLPQEAPNAFATGRSPRHAAVAVTEGLKRLMNREEIEGVIAHELGHVRNRDILISSIAATLAGAIMVLARLGHFAMLFGGYGHSRDDRGGNGGGAIGALLTILLAPLAAMLIQMAISRSREYQADATAAAMVGHPYGLARALEKLGRYSGQIPLETSPAASHMFIVQPLSGGSLLSLFSTHPPVQERIRRLLGR
jgi:heat shock protein HtpX